MNEEVLMAYVDGDLPAAERGRVAEHVVGCDECRAAVRDLRAVSGLLAKWQAPEPVGLPTAGDLLARAGVATKAAAVKPEVAISATRPAGWRLSDVARRWGAAAAILLFASVTGLLVLPGYFSTSQRETAAQRSPAAPAAAPAAKPEDATATPAGTPQAGPPATNSAAAPSGQSSGLVGAPNQPANEAAHEEGASAGGSKDDARREEKQAKEAAPSNAADGTATGEAQADQPADVRSEPAAASKPEATPAPGRSAAAPAPAPSAPYAPEAGGRAAPENAVAARRQLARLDTAVAGVMDLAGQVGGRVVGNPTYGNGADGRTATVTIQVPAAKYASAADRLRGISGVTNVSPSRNRADEQERDKVAKKSATEVEYVTVTVSIRGQ